jgi:hypothetical protein
MIYRCHDAVMDFVACSQGLPGIFRQRHNWKQEVHNEKAYLWLKVEDAAGETLNESKLTVK